MTSIRFGGFLNPSLSTKSLQFVCKFAAFLDPSPFSADVIYGSPPAALLPAVVRLQVTDLQSWAKKLGLCLISPLLVQNIRPGCAAHNESH